MSELLQFTFSGLTVGAIYALVALGFTLIFNTSQVINFAQGEFVMLGGMVTVFGAAAGIPLPLAALLAVVVAVLFGVALYRFAIAPARGASPVTLIIITIGASIMMRGIAAVVFDKNFHGFASPLGDAPLKIGGAAILPQSLLVFAGVAFIVAGKSMLATADNPLAARLVGIDTSRMIEISFAVSATIGAVGGILATPIALTSYSTGTFLALKGFVAAMLGGMGSPLGAVIGGLLLGLIEQLGAGYLSSQYKDAIAVVVLLLVLFIRPSGLFGKAGIERV
jgi:branched-chain amino acid transport system permease protein